MDEASVEDEDGEKPRPKPERRRWRFQLGTLLLGVLSCAIALAALRNFYVLAFTIEGVAVAMILLPVGGVVGRIFSEVPTARQIAVVVSAAMLGGIIRGNVYGERFVLWSFACLTFGLLIGLLSAPMKSPVHE